MTSKAALFALLALWGVGAAAPNSAFADDIAATGSQSDGDDAGTDDLTDRVWVKDDPAGIPSTIKIFLSDGTLVQDSCWETHRLSPWQQVSSQTVSWNEDGIDIKADVVTLTATELVLNLKLAGGDVTEHYVTASVPYACPDMPKS